MSKRWVRARQRAGAWAARVVSRRRAAIAGRRSAGVSTAGMSTAGMSTAEYAIGTLAACAFAALLYKVVTSPQILELLTGLVSRALHAPF
jgi:hypothetical protein